MIASSLCFEIANNYYILPNSIWSNGPRGKGLNPSDLQFCKSNLTHHPTVFLILKRKVKGKGLNTSPQAPNPDTNGGSPPPRHQQLALKYRLPHVLSVLPLRACSLTMVSNTSEQSYYNTRLLEMQFSNKIFSTNIFTVSPAVELSRESTLPLPKVTLPSTASCM